MKETPLTKVHTALGARMVEFAGYNMPLSYAGIKEEHQVVRDNVGVFDVSHMGEFIVRGKEALELIQAITTNDASKLSIGRAQYSALPNETGGLLDDLLVYRLPEDMCSEGEQAFMLVVNASNIEKDWDWIKSKNTFDTKLINISDQLVEFELDREYPAMLRVFGGGILTATQEQKLAPYAYKVFYK